MRHVCQVSQIFSSLYVCEHSSYINVSSHSDGVRDRDVDRECDRRRLPFRARNNVFGLPAVFGRTATYSSLSSTPPRPLPPPPPLPPVTTAAYSVEPEAIEFLEADLFDTFRPVHTLTTHLLTTQQRQLAHTLHLVLQSTHHHIQPFLTVAHQSTTGRPPYDAVEAVHALYGRVETVGTIGQRQQCGECAGRAETARAAISRHQRAECAQCSEADVGVFGGWREQFGDEAEVVVL